MTDLMQMSLQLAAEHRLMEQQEQLGATEGLLAAVDLLDERLGRLMQLWFTKLDKVLRPSILRIICLWRLQVQLAHAECVLML